MDNKTLLMWLEAPLQSWGHDSKFGRRGTLEFPTKSGVIGVICCAMGLSDPDPEILTELVGCGMKVDAYARKNRFSDEAENQTVLTDFHMVGSGFDTKDPWQDLMVPKTSEGKRPASGGPRMTFRHYIQDMAFAVTLEVPEELLVRVKAALADPVWDIYLGRKSCAPTEFILQGVFDDEQQAREKALSLALEKSRMKTFSVEEGAKNGEVLMLTDVPVRLGPIKAYRDRKVTILRE
jgi:CRISPR system Cascade subunit CasD